MSSPVAFALDLPSLAEARDAAREVAPAVGMVKVGLELFVQAGPEAVKIGREVERPVFLDLKLHDIPETVERAVAQASNLGARLVTVHASGGRAMLRRAVKRAETEGGTLAICAVTILTSLDDGDLDDVGINVTRRVAPFNPAAIREAAPAPAKEPSRASLAALGLAELAYEEGVRWFVCSAAEVASLRAKLGPGATIVTPGIRPADASAGDQKRVATPEQAMKDGADWLVVGRPIRDAANRLEAARAIAEAAAAARAS
ncbi:MAG: orotidine-5'-phosphate decarboxylase [Labilithrix sp.]|nr:orotidine-5'-phosphate decarboxylase [Labilithrix sp.]MCW5817390.1 orotidine-5'-phosphate decarboxylase [Labilithrix sp.]